MRLLLVLLLATTAGLGQPSFEAASIKPSPQADLQDRFGVGIDMQMRGGPGSPNPGQITFTNASLFSMIVSAFGKPRYQVSGPTWLGNEGFNVVAKVPAGTSKEQVKLMLQNLLAERFQLKAHIEKRDLPVYILSVSKNGANMKLCVDPDTGGSIGPWNGAVRVVAPNWTMEGLAGFLSPRLDRPVLNQTGLTARYDFTLYWAADNYAYGQSTEGKNVVEASEPAPTIFAALQQLGLKLDRAVRKMDMLVIDHAEKAPTEN